MGKKTQATRLEEAFYETNFVAYWRPIAAYVYLFICIFDFIIMPSIYEWSNQRQNMQPQIEQALRFKDTTGQIEALKLLKTSRVWQPLTLNESGLFHIAFAAILGAAAWTRGQEKVQKVKELASAINNDTDPGNGNNQNG